MAAGEEITHSDIELAKMFVRELITRQKGLDERLTVEVWIFVKGRDGKLRLDSTFHGSFTARDKYFDDGRFWDAGYDLSGILIGNNYGELHHLIKRTDGRICPSGTMP